MTSAQMTKPVKALIIHQIKANPFAQDRLQSLLVTEHKIHQRPGDAVPMIGAGKAL